MDEKIEEMAKAIEYAINNDCKLNNGKSCEDCIFDNNGDWNCQNILVATHLFGENYRKESDTAREILAEAKKWVKAHYKDKVTDSFGEREMLFMEAFGCLFEYLKEKYEVK